LCTHFLSPISRTSSLTVSFLAVYDALIFFEGGRFFDAKELADRLKARKAE
jgi:hypothetical protein